MTTNLRIFKREKLEQCHKFKQASPNTKKQIHRTCHKNKHPNPTPSNVIAQPKSATRRRIFPSNVASYAKSYATHKLTKTIGWRILLKKRTTKIMYPKFELIMDACAMDFPAISCNTIYVGRKHLFFRFASNMNTTNGEKKRLDIWI